MNPRTNYRIRVAAGLTSAESARDLTEVGEWSDIMSVTTLDNQKISEWTVDDEAVSAFAMPDNGNINENSFISSYSSLHQHPPGKQVPDSFVFHKPAFIYGHHEWTFGKHFFQIDASLLDKEGTKPEVVETQCFLTIGLICTAAPAKEALKQPAPKKKEDERVIVGCKVGIKVDSVAQVQVFINVEKHIMLCIANGKVKEKFDLSTYESFLPVVKYDGDAHT